MKLSLIGAKMKPSTLIFNVILLEICLIGVKSQDFNKKPIDLTQRKLHRRQLTPVQQSHILSDIQQHHHHRFNLNNHPPAQQQQQQLPPFLFQQQPSVEIPLIQTQRSHINQRLPPPPPPPPQLSPQPQPPLNVRFPQNSFRNVPSPNSANSNNSPLSSPHSSSSPSVVQHHTQTNFIPNFVQQQPPQGNNNLQFQRSLQNQVQNAQQQQQQQTHQGISGADQQTPDQDFHAQNFITLRNHFVQTGGIPLAASNGNQQFLHPQQQQQTFQTNVQSQQLLPDTRPAPGFHSQPAQQQQASNIPHPVTSQFPGTTAIGQQQLQQYNQNSHFSQQQFLGNPQFQNFSPQSSIAPFQSVSHLPSPLSPDQEAKQKLIQKHEQFVQKQYEKQQNRVKQLHDEFVQKQQTIKEFSSSPVRQSNFGDYDRQQNYKSRPISPSEAHLFGNALQKYYEEHPTTTTTTTTTTAKVTTEDPLEKLLQAHRKDIYSQLKLESDKSRSSGKNSKSKPKATKTVGRDELIKQLRLALAENPQQGTSNKSFDSTDLVLPNGENIQVIRTSDPNLIAGSSQNYPQFVPNVQQQTRSTDFRRGESKNNVRNVIDQIAPSRPTDFILPTGEKVEIIPAPVPSPKAHKDVPRQVSKEGFGESLASAAQIVSSDGPPSIEELARRGLIPEGYEIIQQPAPGSRPNKVEPVPTAAAPKKKATFVYLEEQSDGSFKIQGVKTNGEKEAKTSGSEVQNILDRIRKGDIKLPPSVTKLALPSDNDATSSSHGVTQRAQTNKRAQSSTQNVQNIQHTQRPKPSTRPPVPTVSLPLVTIPPSTISPYSTLTPLVNRASSPSNHAAASSTHQTTITPTTKRGHGHVTAASSTTYSTKTATSSENPTSPSSSNEHNDLIQILKSHNLFAMAKYLKQSGLDNILNETGPYTIFAPTDKAFKHLLIQLGGPERAEEKFKANPRLLSGLLLHHVIPGAFEISSLQDEMTGVSLAGTQLRVNQYTMHDQEWNDVLVTTINGATVVNEKQDIKIPQGVAHGVDRVMFPLPVGDLLQTLQSDRENRFTSFLKVLYTSGLSEILQNKGIKTYTVFAPIDKAFTELPAEKFEKLLSDKDAAQTFAMKHIVPGTLFSAGMRFYQIKDSLLTGKSVTLQKANTGKIKVNEAQMITSNIPATNGVIHALDSIL